ncbi:MAG TPA: hypothetical protein ENN67_04005 [Firmicutes bacterium]|nr:hypothetical protein [Bacillota bacterium]
MPYKTIAFFAILLAVLSLAVYWYVSRPTPEEKALLDFFSEFKNGKYAEAQEYTANNDFYTMAAETSVRDTNGKTYLIGSYFPESQREILRYSIETYVRRHISKWKYTFMETAKMGTDSSVVHFRLDIGIREFTTGEGMFGTAHEGSVEGNAFMVFQNGQWAIEKFELNLSSDEGLVLEKYLSMRY